MKDVYELAITGDQSAQLDCFGSGILFDHFSVAVIYEFCKTAKGRP